MEDYKRLVSYMYNYENKAKKSNVGYARVESKNGFCKIMIHIKALNVEVRQLKAYIFHRENNEIKCIFLGYLNVKNGIAECRLQTNTEDIMDTGLSLNEMGGIVVYVSSDRYYGTEWDDKPISLSSIELLEKKQVEELAASSNIILEAAQVEKEPEPLKVVSKDIEQDEIESKQITKEQQQEQVKIVDEEVSEKECEKSERKINQADQIFMRYPKMYPFEDDEIIDCVRIEPQDIGIFPMENWIYANNSFLLHSYYSYRHLIFAKKKAGDGYQYILGVPGIYHNREQFMARMFGFYNFKPIRNREHKTGEFGYWYFILVL